MSAANFKQLEQTESLCPVCHKLLPARIVTDKKEVFLEKVCQDHGHFRGSVWTDYDLYLQSYRFRDFVVEKQSKEGATRTSERVAVANLEFELQQRTCLALLEVTDRCNLKCPVCIANSANACGDLPLPEIESTLKSLIAKSGEAIPIQISGGEPTLRIDLPQIVSLAKELKFQFVEVNTNGIEIGRRPDLAWQLADAGLDGIYLQFDGLNGRVHKALRGKDLLRVKQQAIEHCQDVGISVTLAATIVKDVNEDQIWPIIEYGVARGTLGVNFQPFTPSGRFPGAWSEPLKKVTASDIIMAVESQSKAMILADDFVPIPCQDNRCALIVYCLVENKELVPLNRKIEPNLILDHYARLSSWEEILNATEDALCRRSGHGETDKRYVSQDPGCCSAEKRLFPEGYFSIGCHDFMDITNFDLARAKKCCLHEITPGGKIVPFCLYNMLRPSEQAM